MAFFISLVFAPILVLSCLTINTFQNYVIKYTEAFSGQLTMSTGLVTGTILYNLQIERDMSVLYCTSGEKHEMAYAKDRLIRRYPMTDASVLKLSIWTLDTGTDKAEFQTMENFIAFIGSHRLLLHVRMFDSEVECTDQLAFYEDVINRFMFWFYTNAFNPRVGEVWKDLSALQELRMALIYAGDERTMGALVFAQGHFYSDQAYWTYVDKREKFIASFKSAKLYSRRIDVLFAQSISIKRGVDETITIMREQIITNNTGDVRLAPDRARWWFDNMTLYMDAIFQVQVTHT